MNKSEYIKLRRLMSSLLDGELNPNERAQFIQLLKENKQGRQFYLQNQAMESILQWESVTNAETASISYVNTPTTQEAPIIPWPRVLIDRPLLIARNWLAGAAAAAIAVGLWVTTSRTHSTQEKPLDTNIALDIHPLKTETTEMDGQTVASIYFQFSSEENRPEG
ncbi:MAG: hypothetical protein HOI65_11235 [Opitutae bacterium]|nr:hypothetical protein [Opitutae bacterium]